MTAGQDFNYKVALASGLRELQAGRLSKAEQQFEYLCAKFPTAPGGYRGIAKVRLEQADRSGALTALRDGAAKLAKAGEHPGVVALLTEALGLDALDLAAHRRLAAAHALAGEMDAACDEYARYAHAISATDPAGAQREIRYGLDSLGPSPVWCRSRARSVSTSARSRPLPRPGRSRARPPSRPSLPAPSRVSRDASALRSPLPRSIRSIREPRSSTR